jgi:hypothetical protein
MQVPVNTSKHEILIHILPVNDKPSFQLRVTNITVNEDNGSAADIHYVPNMLQRVTKGIHSAPRSLGLSECFPLPSPPPDSPLFGVAVTRNLKSPEIQGPQI